MGAESHEGAAGGSPPALGMGGSATRLTAAAGIDRLKGQDEVAGGDKPCVPGSAEGTAGQCSHLCRKWESGVGELLAEVAFPGAAPGRTIPGRAAEGSCRPLPLRKRTRWLWPLLLSLFLLFDLRRARSPVGSLSWLWCCLTTCSEDRAEEEAVCLPEVGGIG